MAKKECTCGYSIGHPLVPKCTCKPTEWIGLTDEEIKHAWSLLWHNLNNGKFAATDNPLRHTTIMFAQAIEEKLKEKNT